MAAIAEAPEFLLKLMKDGYFNEKCPIKIHDRIVKTLTEEGDFNPEGTTGIVVGNIIHPLLGDAYLVVFDGLGGLEIFISGVKIKKI